MLIGPVFTRELAIAPRRSKLYVARTAYPLALLVLMGTAWLVLTGTQLVRDVGDLARFGSVVFQILTPLQLALAMFFSGLLAAGAVAHEKDRHTLLLLLLTNLSNSELVLGKLLSSLLYVFITLVSAVPVFMLAALFGGVSYGQIAMAFAVTLATVLVCGSLGSMLGLWREKTFQALAMTVLVLVLWLALGEIIASGALGDAVWGWSNETVAAAVSPWRAVLDAARPYVRSLPELGPFGTPAGVFLLVAVIASAIINAVAIAMVRIWNRSEGREERRQTATAAGEHPLAEASLASVVDATAASNARAANAARQESRTRRVWDNPIIWREIRTWAYGRRLIVMRLAYLVLFGLAAAGLHGALAGNPADLPQQAALALIPMLMLSLVLVNAQAVTSLTSERDVRALDLLLVTDLTPKEIVYGKLGGVFYNTKEMVLLPMLLCAAMWWKGPLSFENLLYLLGGLAVLYVFAAMVGLHTGMTYGNSGVAIATSLGTIFFLFVGVAVCMYIMMAFSSSFQAQFVPFFAFMLFGGVGLYVVLGVRNPSAAIGVASFLCPFATFYAITSYLLGGTLAVFLVTAAAYGFTTAAMLVPAIYEFDVATGRTTIED